MGKEEKHYPKAIKENLDAILKERHMSKKDLAEKVGVSPPSVSQWFGKGNKEKDTTMTLENFFRVCDVLGVTGDELSGRNTGVYLSSEEIEMLRAYRAASDRDRDIIHHILNLPESLGEWEEAKEA